MKLSLLVLIVIPAMALCGSCSSLARSAGEKLPKKVVEITRTQIKGYIGKSEITGVPLLDRKVNWDAFNNWPDEFVYQGRTYRLQLTDTSGGDVLLNLNSRIELRPGKGFLARYITDTEFPPPLGVSAAWYGNGALSEKVVAVYDKTVYGQLLVPTGELYLFLRDDFATKAYISEYYNASGRVVGFDSWNAGKRRCEWDGIEIDDATLMKRHKELYHSFGK